MKRKIEWQTLLFGIFWTGYTLFTLFQYFNGTLGSFRVPKIIALVYDSIGFMPTMILQLVFGLFLIFIAFPKKEEKNDKEKE